MWTDSVRTKKFCQNFTNWPNGTFQKFAHLYLRPYAINLHKHSYKRCWDNSPTQALLPEGIQRSQCRQYYKCHVVGRVLAMDFALSPGSISLTPNAVVGDLCNYVVALKYNSMTDAFHKCHFGVFPCIEVTSNCSIKAAVGRRLPSTHIKSRSLDSWQSS